MLQEFSIALFLYGKNKPYDKLLTLAIAMYDGLTAMSGVYTTPFPTLATLATQITALQNAITAWNNKKGSKAQLATLRTEAKNTRSMLKQLAQYMMDTDPNNPDNWISVGVEVKSAGSPIGMLQAVEALRQIVSPTVQVDWVRLKWRKPLGSERAHNIKYRILRNTTDELSTATQVGIASKTSFDYQPPTTDGDYYWAIPVNSNGTDGVVADPVFARPNRISN